MFKKKTCRMCGGKKFKTVINFGKNALVNSLIERDDLHKKEKVYPLIVEQCQDCSLVQIVNSIDSNKIYKDEDYLYFSGDMPGLQDYFAEFVKELHQYIEHPNDLVMEIGSNDGAMLQHWATQIGVSCRVLGVDPASNVVVRALKGNIPTISDFFTERLAKSIRKEWGQAKIIGGANCIAHLNDLHDMMRGVKHLLKDDGVFWVECNYWGGMVENKNYSLIYHDHFSYFTLKNWMTFLDKFDMKVFDAYVTPAQGGSLRIFACNKSEEKMPTDRMIKLLNKEEKTRLNSYKTAKKYNKEVIEEAGKLNELITEIKEQGKTIAGYGAAAKGFSVLKLAEIDGTHIDYFIDDSPAKQGKFTPVTHIPVISRAEASKQLPDYFFITAPNYEKVIIDKEHTFLEEGGKFITVDSRTIGPDVN